MRSFERKPLENHLTQSDPAFAAMTPLIEPIKDAKNSFVKQFPAKDGRPTQPGSSFHIDAYDHDHDHDHDHDGDWTFWSARSLRG